VRRETAEPFQRGESTTERSGGAELLIEEKDEEENKLISKGSAPESRKNREVGSLGVKGKLFCRKRAMVTYPSKENNKSKPS